jgi:hypothetical protein
MFLATGLVLAVGVYFVFSAGVTCPSASAAPPPGFVRVCGLQLSLNGQPFIISGATAYGQYDNAEGEVALARQAHLNTLEIVEFETEYHALSAEMSAATWKRVDTFIAAARAGGLHVILNLSGYGQSLAAAGQIPTTTDWGPYLTFIADRVNTVTRVRYADDPTIAMVELYGEINAPGYGAPTAGTTAEMNAFFKRTLAEWKALAPHIIVSTGGFSYINDPRSGISWKTIVADPGDAVCDIEVNAYADRDMSVPDLSAYCRRLGKPWFLATWSSCYRQGPNFNGDIDSWQTDADMAAHARDMYKIAADKSPAAPGPAVSSVGTDFWNLAVGPAGYGTCDIGPQFPRTFSVVQGH